MVQAAGPILGRVAPDSPETRYFGLLFDDGYFIMREWPPGGEMRFECKVPSGTAERLREKPLEWFRGERLTAITERGKWIEAEFGEARLRLEYAPEIVYFVTTGKPV